MISDYLSFFKFCDWYFKSKVDFFPEFFFVKSFLHVKKFFLKKKSLIPTFLSN